MVLAIWWSPLKKGWVKLKTDGVVSYFSNCTLVGGVFRDVDTRWLCGFSLAVVKKTIFRAEARTMLEGFRIAWEKGFRQLELEYDNALLVETLLAGRVTNSSLVELRLINCIFRRTWKIRRRHIPKNQNAIANQMAKYINNGTPNLLLFIDPPSLLQRVLQFENNAFTRI
ncbi:hypothetical protein PVK06_030929 [Gossypium arboreum]|uniref:RNase H type-1 domain-containing protein n=1 Tax=Gossypium arboreum TaxID=29729 RepID=A0ABR0NQ73_GOSAR|nr:hypothetical protein PVK06_030929 [Gossypium arboreum]